MKTFVGKPFGLIMVTALTASVSVNIAIAADLYMGSWTGFTITEIRYEWDAVSLCQRLALPSRSCVRQQRQSVRGRRKLQPHIHIYRKWDSIDICIWIESS